MVEEYLILAWHMFSFIGGDYISWTAEASTSC